MNSITSLLKIYKQEAEQQIDEWNNDATALTRLHIETTKIENSSKNETDEKILRCAVKHLVMLTPREKQLLEKAGRIKQLGPHILSKKNGETLEQLQAQIKATAASVRLQRQTALAYIAPPQNTSLFFTQAYDPEVLAQRIATLDAKEVKENTEEDTVLCDVGSNAK